MRTPLQSSGLQLRWADASDAPLLAALNEQLIADEGHDNPMRGEQLVERMRGWLAGDYAAALGTLNGAPAVYALWRPDDDGGGIYLRQFFIARDFRRLGLGRAAIELLRTDYWPADCAVSLDVLSHNERGIAFWRSVGFHDYCITMKDRDEPGG